LTIESGKGVSAVSAEFSTSDEIALAAALARLAEIAAELDEAKKADEKAREAVVAAQKAKRVTRDKVIELEAAMANTFVEGFNARGSITELAEASGRASQQVSRTIGRSDKVKTEDRGERRA
jgi:predicted transcriptional regulator